ncbi:MAG: HAD family hydrolase, partial [Myxococcota bacterium]
PPQRRQLRFVWARPRCTFRFDAEYRERYCIKNLRKVKRLGYDLGHVLAVDDTPRKYERSYGNLVPVEPFLGNPNDRELLALIHYLEHLRDVPNVRAIEKRGWQLAERRLHH